MINFVEVVCKPGVHLTEQLFQPPEFPLLFMMNDGCVWLIRVSIVLA